MPRAYVLAPLVALALTLGGVGAVLGLRLARETAPAAVSGEPVATAAPAEGAAASAVPAAVAPAPPPEAIPAAPAPATTASAAAASTAEAAEAGAAEKGAAAAEAEAPAPKEQPAAAKEQATKAPAAAKAAPAAAEDDEDIYATPQRQRPSFLRVLEEQKKAAPAKTAAPAQQGSAKPAKPCPAAGCRPF
ncbi:hypothetical protein [Sorangium sp. So ce233]|uniref:hypothetical protein n=1 Tax=Sorangium sp. So ce233 TaxID=3133290 RepID=UPI003F6114C7